MSNLVRAFLAAASIVAAAGELAADVKDDPRRRLQQLEQDIARDRAQGEKLKQRAADLGAEVEKVRARAIAAARSAQESERALARLQAEIEGLARAEAEAAKRLADRRAEAGATVMALQRIALHPPEAMFVQPGPPSDLVRGAILLRAAVPEVERRANAVRADLAQLRAAKAEGARALARQAAEIAKFADERRGLDEILARRTALARETSVEASALERRAARLAAEARGLNELMDRLEAESARRRGSAAQSRTAARPSPQAPPLSPSTTPFARSRGQLPMPAVGQVVLRYGQTTAAGLTHKGITLETQAQATVVAPFAGYVVFADEFRGYGQLLILDHGDGYHTLLAGLDRIDGVAGLWVETGEPVGVMGAGDKSRLQLYVEIRRGGQPFDPLPWLAANNGKVSG